MTTRHQARLIRVGVDQPTPYPGHGAPLAQVRGVLAERVVVSTPLDPFLSLRALADYSGLSVRKLHDLIVDSANPLPHFRIGGKLLVRRSDYDQWAAQYRRVGLSVDDLIARHRERERRGKGKANAPSDLPGASSSAA